MNRNTITTNIKMLKNLIKDFERKLEVYEIIYVDKVGNLFTKKLIDIEDIKGLKKQLDITKEYIINVIKNDDTRIKLNMKLEDLEKVFTNENIYNEYEIEVVDDEKNISLKLEFNKA